MKQVRKCIENVQKMCVTKVDNNQEIISVRPSLDLGNKIWIWKTIYRHSQKPLSRFLIFTTRKL